MITLPTAPWKEVAVDFAGPFPSRDYIVVVVDEFSRFPEVELLTSTSAKAVVPKLDAIFSKQGVPDILKSDNGPPFNGHEFKTFADYVGIKHRKTTPLWPKANGEADRLVQTLEKTSGLPTQKARIGSRTGKLLIPQHMFRLVKL